MQIVARSDSGEVVGSVSSLPLSELVLAAVVLRHMQRTAADLTSFL